MEEVQKLTTEDPVKLVVGNKSEKDYKTVSERDMLVFIQFILKNFSERTGIDVITTSAKESINITHVFDTITAKLLDKL